MIAPGNPSPGISGPSLSQVVESHMDSGVMEAKLFTLVNAENEDQIVAWGMQVSDAERTEAVIYHRDPDTGKSLTGTHECAEKALALWGMVAPMRLRWETTPEDVLEMMANLGS